MEYLDVGVELFADAMTDECTHNPELVLLRSCLDRLTDVGERSTWHHCFDASPHALFGDIDQMSALLVDRTDCKRGVGVTVDALVVAGDIEIDDVSIFQDS